jgi:hypothetical protein
MSLQFYFLNWEREKEREETYIEICALKKEVFE